MSVNPTPPATPVSDLFQPTLQDWAEQPAQAFEHWLAARGYRESSATVYRAMWRKWLRWVESHQRESMTPSSELHRRGPGLLW